MFGYVTGGYEKINNQFAEYLLKTGLTLIRFKSKVVKKTSSGMLEVMTENDSSYVFDYVISTLSSKESVTIAEGLTDAEKQKHE